MSSRSCGDCSKCCEGWLESDIYGKKMFPGQPCFFIGDKCKGCSIYEQRPQDPCKDYTCAWLTEPEIFPNWMKPTESGVIITKKIPPEGEAHSVYQVVETDKKIGASILNWLIHWALQGEINLQYQVDGKFHTLLSKKTQQEINKTDKYINHVNSEKT